MATSNLAAVKSSALRLIEEIRRLQSEVGQNLWRMGKALDTLRTEHETLWRREHPTWDAFARAELGITGGYALKLIDVSRNFTETQVRECGATKLVRILPVPEPDRPRFIQEAKTASLTEIRASVNRFTAERSADAPGGRLLTRATGRRGAHRVRRIQHVDTGEKVVALYASAGGRAKRIEEKPRGRILLGSAAYVVQVRSTEQGLVVVLRLEGKDE